jgi:IclR family pca regulon transcriptional regulator
MDRQTEKQAAYFSESLARGLSVLRAFDRDAPRLRIRDVAERTGLNRAAVRRFLLTLRDLGYVACENDLFFLRPRVLNLGYSYLASTDVRGLTQPLLDELAEQTGEATTLAVLDGMEALILVRACKRKYDLAIGSGSRLPLHATALGHVLLAALSESKLEIFFRKSPDLSEISSAGKEALRRRLKLVKEQDYAGVEGLLNKQLVAVAVPIRDRNGQVVAALNVTSYTTPLKHNLVNKKFLKPLYAAKSQIEAALLSSDAIPLIGDEFTGRSNGLR